MCGWNLRASTPVHVNLSSILHEKNYFFLFYTTTYIKHPHQFFYFTRYFNKIFTFLIFLLFFSTAYQYTRVLTLSLYSFFLNWKPLSLSLSVFLFSPFSHSFPKTTNPDYFLTGSFHHRPIQILSSLADPFFTGYPDPFFLKTTNLDHFFTESFLHRPIQILSSSADPRTKLRRCRSFLHRPIHEPSFGNADPFFTGRSTN